MSWNYLISDGVFQWFKQSFVSSTVLRKWVHLVHNPLLNAEYAASGLPFA